MIKAYVAAALAASVIAFGFSAPAKATVIDFEAFGTGNLSNTEVIDGVEFSVINPTPTEVIRIVNTPFRTAYILACETSPGFNCAQDMNVGFSTDVFNVSFDILADEALGSSGTVTAYLDGSVVGSISLFGDGDGNTHNLIDLSSFGLIDQLVLSSSLDPAGLGYDNFSFSVVPVPAAVWLFGSGLLGLIGVTRRKKQA